MEFFKHKNYRNPKYLSWLRKQQCCVSERKAQCAHHVRLRTNGGKGLKPSDYFCLPLTHEYHTLGHYALHIIGEETFVKTFKINAEQIFVQNLSGFLKEEYNFSIKELSTDSQLAILELVTEIEMRRPIATKNPLKKIKITKKNKQENHSAVKTPKISESEYYQKAQEYRRQKDKELRKAMKESEKKSAPKVALKTSKKKKMVTAEANKEFYEKAKELKRKFDKESRDKNKQKASELRKELYQRAKERNKKFKEENSAS